MGSMARSRLCRTCGSFHDLATPWPEACADHFGTVAEPGFQIISDTMVPMRSMADGKMYDSKSRYRGDLKARGLIEVGNESMTQKPVARPPVRDTLRQTYRQLGG